VPKAIGSLSGQQVRTRIARDRLHVEIEHLAEYEAILVDL
jgi:hypothetical protein